MVLHRSLKTLLGAACLLIVLGLGNIFYGAHKTSEYLKLISEAANTLKNSRLQTSPSMLAPTINIDKEIQHINRLNARVDFYKFISLGGKFLLCLGVILIVIFAFNLRNLGKTDTKQ